MKNQPGLTILDALADPAIFGAVVSGQELDCIEGFSQGSDRIADGQDHPSTVPPAHRPGVTPGESFERSLVSCWEKGWKESDKRSHRCIRSFLEFWNWILELDWETSSMEFWIGILGAPRSILGRLLLQRANVLNYLIRFLRCDFPTMRSRRCTHFDGTHFADTTNYDLLQFDIRFPLHVLRAEPGYLKLIKTITHLIAFAFRPVAIPAALIVNRLAGKRRRISGQKEPQKQNDNATRTQFHFSPFLFELLWRS